MVQLPPVANVIKVIQTGTCGGISVANVFHVKYDQGGSPITQSNLQGIVDQMRTKYVSRFGPLISNQCTIGATFGQDLSSELGNQATNSSSSIGTNVTAPAANSLALCITWKIQRHYRGGHPRTYLFGMAANAVQDPTSWTSTIVTNAATFANGFIADMNVKPAGSTLVSCGLTCVHYYKDKHLLAVPTTDDFFAAVVDNRLDTQRRRLGRDR